MQALEASKVDVTVSTIPSGNLVVATAGRDAKVLVPELSVMLGIFLVCPLYHP